LDEELQWPQQPGRRALSMQRTTAATDATAVRPAEAFERFSGDRSAAVG